MRCWSIITLSELVESREADLQTGPFGTQLKASDYVEEGIPVINVRNIGYGNIRPENLEYIEERTAERLKVHKLKKGDIVFGRKGAVDRHALIDEKTEDWLQGSDCLRLRVESKRVCNRYLSYYFNTSAHKYWMEAVCSFGATMSSLNQDIVKRIGIPLPPIGIQEKIAAILSAYDDLIENNKRRIALLEKMAEEIYREWFVRMRFPEHKKVKFEKGVPEGWEQTNVGDLLKRIPSGKKYEQKTALEVGKVPILDQGQSGIIGYHNRAPGVTASIDHPIIVFANHTCYQRLIFFPFSAIQNILPFAPSERKKSNIFWLHFTTKRCIEFSEYKGHWPEFITKKIYYPGFDLTEEFGLLVSPILKKSYRLEEINRKLVVIQNRLLSRLISGKLSVENLDIQFPPSMLDEAETDKQEVAYA